MLREKKTRAAADLPRRGTGWGALFVILVVYDSNGNLMLGHAEGSAQVTAVAIIPKRLCKLWMVLQDALLAVAIARFRGTRT